MRAATAFALAALLLGGNACAQDWAMQRLNDSPRHAEWVDIAARPRTLHAFVVYPERAGNTPAVIMIHENRGLTDWVRSAADELAAAGYLVVAPDLLSGFDAKHDRTSDFADADAARDAIYQLDPDQVTGDLKAARDYAAQLPASSGDVAVMGFCWGGSQTFRFATNTDGVKAALVFYGTAPEEKEALARIQAPIYGFYGEKDQRINATLPATKAAMGELGKTYEPEIYAGAGHAFMRLGDDPDADPELKKARDGAFQRMLDILDGLR